MRFVRAISLAAAVAVSPWVLFGQSISSISPNYGPTTPGGGNTFTGSGLSTAPDAVRFVDASNNDVFSGVTCSSTTSCTAYARAGLALPGQIRTIAVYAMVNGVRGATPRNFIYYGPPVITGISPSSGPRTSSTATTISGRGFTSTANGLPGTTSVYLLTTLNDKTSGCTNSTTCAFTAPAINDCCVSNGVYAIQFITPGGVTYVNFTYAPPAPATPTITNVSPRHGSRDGGNTVTITGTNFSTASNRTSFTVSTYGPSATTSTVFGTCPSTTSCTVVMPPGSGKADIVAAVNGGSAPTWNSAPSRNTFADDYTYAGVNVMPGSNKTLYTTEAGGTATLMYSLTKAPASNVTLDLSTTPAGQASVSPPILVFTPSNWSIPQIATITGIDNGTVGVNSGGSVTGVSSSSDAHFDNIFANSQQFQNLDNETAAVAFSETDITTAEGGVKSISVVLTKAPTAVVTLNLTSTDTTEGLVSPSTLTFNTTSGGANGWNTVRTVMISGVQDPLEDGDIGYSIITKLTTTDATYGALTVNDLFATNTDDESGCVFPVAQGDFNADGRDDVLLRDSIGNFGMWIMNGSTIASGAFVGSPGDYRVAGIADFNNNGVDDILLRDSSGNVGLWLMNGSAIAGGGFVGSLGSSTIIGVEDFTGDGMADILTVDSVGNVGMWIMNGSTITAGGLVSALGDYTVVATRDFNADGRADVLLRDPLGNVGVWFMNGFAITGGGLIGSPGGYSIVGANDFNADGRADILLRDPIGNLGLWFMNGTTISAGAAIGSAGTVYRTNSLGDYNGDGRADILLRHEINGDVGMWLMNGATIIGGAAVASPGPSYTEF